MDLMVLGQLTCLMGSMLRMQQVTWLKSHVFLRPETTPVGQLSAGPSCR